MFNSHRTRGLSQRFDAFISHSSKNKVQAALIESAVGAKRAWFDRSDIRLGALLGRELLSHILKSRSLILVWSGSAAQSPWVQSEWIAAANIGKPIVPIRLDKTPLPQCLTNTLWQPAASSLRASVTEVARAVRGRLPRGGSISPSMRFPDARLEAERDRLGLAQQSMLADFYAGSMTSARRQQRRLERETKALVAKYPRDPRAAILWAYNEKNGVILDRDADITAGIKVGDKRLGEARWRFLHALWLDPLDAEALNGLGTIAWFGHDLDTAEFFVRAALRRVPNYPAAKHDLTLILQLRAPRFSVTSAIARTPARRKKD
jgi:TIR domain-containing protein